MSKKHFPYDFIAKYSELLKEYSEHKEFFSTLSQEDHQILVDENIRRNETFQEGYDIYRSLNYERSHGERPVIWEQGSAKLYDYTETFDPKAPVLFAVPSLVNKPYILDLHENKSFLGYLSKKGIQVYLLDWGALGEEEKAFTLEDYITKYLLSAYDALEKKYDRSLSLFGYCMGGVLTLAAAQLRPQTGQVILLASPWDFHKEIEWAVPFIDFCSNYFEHVIDFYGELPPEMIQQLFALMNPNAVLSKFRKLPGFADNLEHLQHFAAVEEWLIDCTPLSAPVAKECFLGWYRDNAPIRGKWKIGGEAIRPETLTQKVSVILPKNDMIVPTESAKAVIPHLKHPNLIEPLTGHIGSIIGKNSETEVLDPILATLKEKETK